MTRAAISKPCKIAVRVSEGVESTVKRDRGGMLVLHTRHCQTVTSPPAPSLVSQRSQSLAVTSCLPTFDGVASGFPERGGARLPARHVLPHPPVAATAQRTASKGSRTTRLCRGRIARHGTDGPLVALRSTGHMIRDEGPSLAHGQRLACGRVLSGL